MTGWGQEMKQWEAFQGNSGTGEEKRGVEAGVSEEPEKQPKEKKANRK